MLLWRFEGLFLKYLNHLQWVIILLIVLGLSLLLHLRAYARSIVDAVQENVLSDKDL